MNFSSEQNLHMLQTKEDSIKFAKSQTPNKVVNCFEIVLVVVQHPGTLQSKPVKQHLPIHANTSKFTKRHANKTVQQAVKLSHTHTTTHTTFATSRRCPMHLFSCSYIRSSTIRVGGSELCRDQAVQPTKYEVCLQSLAGHQPG